MTTAAERKRDLHRHHYRGQSIVEFALILPILITLITVLVQVETAISMSIVSQKYAHSHLYFMLFNHHMYPEKDRQIHGPKQSYMRRWWIGIDENSNFSAGQVVHPVAPTVAIGTGKTPQGDDQMLEDTGGTRQNVRIKSAAFVCIPPVGYKLGQPFSENNLGDTVFTGGYEYCSSAY